MSYYQFEGIKNQSEAKGFIERHPFLNRLAELGLSYASTDYKGQIEINNQLFGKLFNPTDGKEGFIFQSILGRIHPKQVTKEWMISFLELDKKILANDVVSQTYLFPKGGETLNYKCSCGGRSQEYFEYSLVTTPLTSSKQSGELIRLLDTTRITVGGESSIERMLKEDGSLSYLNQSQAEEIKRLLSPLNVEK